MADLKEADTPAATLFGILAHGHAAPAAVKNAIYDVVTNHFNGDHVVGRGGRSSAMAEAVAARSQVGLHIGGCRGGAAGVRPWAVPEDESATRRHTRSGHDRQPIHAANRRRSALAAAAAAEARAGAVLRGRCCCSSTASSSGRSIFSFTEFEDDAELWPRPASSAYASGLWTQPNWYMALAESGDLRHALYRHLHRARAAAGDPARPEASAARACCGRSISIRWRCPSSSPARPGNGSSIPASAWRRPCIDWGWDELHLRLADQVRTMAIYTVVIAAVWQSSGFVMAMFLAGLRGIDNEILKAAQIDGASTIATLPAHRHPHAAAGVPVGLHRARPSGDQVLRPGDRADRRRAGPRHGTAGDLHVFLHLHPQPDGRRRGQRGDHADDHRGDHRALPLFRAAGEAP